MKTNQMQCPGTPTVCACVYMYIYTHMYIHTTYTLHVLYALHNK